MRKRTSKNNYKILIHISNKIESIEELRHGI